MKAEKETESSSPTPEQLLTLLESERTMRRSQNANSSRNRAIFLVAGLLFIVIAAGAALLVLDQMLADLRNGGREAHTAPAEVHGNF